MLIQRLTCQLLVVTVKCSPDDAERRLLACLQLCAGFQYQSAALTSPLTSNKEAAASVRRASRSAAGVTHFFAFLYFYFKH